MSSMMDRMTEGRAHEREIDMLYELTKEVEGHTIVRFLLFIPFPGWLMLYLRLTLTFYSLVRAWRRSCVAHSRTLEELQ